MVLDDPRSALQRADLPRPSRFDRRALLRAAGGLGVAGWIAAAAPGSASAITQTGGATLTTSRPREAVMREILATYPLRRAGAPAGGTALFANTGDLGSVNPLLAGSAAAMNLIPLVFESLVGIHPVDGSIIPGLADYDLAADGITYTFRIHPDARFHDGTPVTAADAEFTFETILDPTSAAPFASSLGAVLKEYRAVDDRTFVMVSNGPIASFLYDANVFVIPKHIWEGIPPADWPSDPGSTGEDPSRVIGSGPFRFVEWIQGDHATIARNDDSWDRTLSQVPSLDRIVFQIYDRDDAALLALEAGGVDLAAVPPEAVSRVSGNSSLEVVRYDGLSFAFYAHQLDPAKTTLFQDRDVREALFIALDRQAMVDSILAGVGEVARGTHPPLSPAYAPTEFEPYAFDPARARALLAQAGWRDADGDGIVEKDGQRFSFTLLRPSGAAPADNVDIYMQEAWKAIGVEMQPEPLPFPALVERVEARDFDMVRVAFVWSIDPGQGVMFETGGPFNFTGFSNPEYDRLEAEQRRTLDPARRIDLIIEQAKIVWDELPVGIIVFRSDAVGYNQRLRNVFPNAYSLVWSAPFWYLEE